MRVSVLISALSVGLVAAAASPNLGFSLVSRQLQGFPTDNATPEEAQCISTCSQGIVESHQSEYENCVRQGTAEEIQACVCKAGYFKEELKCIAKCFSGEVAKQVQDAANAACAQVTGGGSNTSGGDKSDEGGAASSLRVPAGAVALVAVALAAGL